MNKTVPSYIIFFLLLLPLAEWGCKSKSFDQRTENLNKGEMTIYADNSYQSLANELVKSYENVYPESKIHIVCGSDQEILDALLADKARMMITGRVLTKDELAALAKVNEIEMEQFPVGKEAIAIITSKNNPDSLFDMDEFLRSRQPGYSGKYANTNFVFNRSNESMLKKMIGNNVQFTNMFSLDGTDTLTHYVAATDNAFGFISFAEIADTDDPDVKALLQIINVVSVAKTDSTGNKKITALSQSTLADKTYPFQRTVMIVKGNVPQLLGTGFVNFMYRSKASRILLKAGLVPEKMPERLINIVE